MKQKAINIIWDVDNETDLDYLPKEIDIPVNIVNIDDISDYISNYTGFCHKGFEMVYQVFKNEIFNTLDEIKNLYMIQSQIKYKGELILILNKKGAKYIFSDQKYIDEKEIWYTECVPFKYHNHYISLYKTKNGKIKYIGHAWYSPTESYIQEFYDLKSCVKWLTDKE